MTGREQNGRFARGNQISKQNGGGRPKRIAEEELVRLLDKAVKPDDWQMIFDVLASRAKAGDKDAAILAKIDGKRPPGAKS